MQAIILAAGMGKRLKDLTKDATKCMVRVNGVTLIERMLGQLDRLGLTRIVLVVGYKARELMSFVSALAVNTPIEFVENADYDKTNNIYSLYLAKEFLTRQDTLLLESDLIFEDSVLESLVDDPYPTLALVAKYESWMDGSVVTLQSDCCIKDFLDKEHFRFEDIKNYYKTVNLYKFGQAFSRQHYVPFLEAYCRALGKNEYYEQVLKVIALVDKSELHAKILEQGRWYEIDDIQDLDIAESIFARSDSEKLDCFQRRYGGYWRYPHLIDFCYLVNPFFPPQKFLDEIKANFDTIITQYPSGQRVNNLLAAKYFGVSPSVLTVGNGAAELIQALLRTVTGNIGVVYPTFEEYPNRVSGEIIAFRPENDHFSYAAEELIRFYDDKPLDALIVINPDNPSGNYLSRDEVLALIRWAGGKGCKLILDESFVDFAAIDDTLLQDPLLAANPHMVVVKSISKAYGVPGLRLGVLACGDRQLMQAVEKELSIWNINSFGEFYLQICEKYKPDFTANMRRFYPVRDAYFEDLKAIAYIEPIPSKANFITCKLTGGVSARKLTEYLLARHEIFIKDLSGKSGLQGEYIRVAVKTQAENNQLTAALRMYRPAAHLCDRAPA